MAPARHPSACRRLFEEVGGPCRLQPVADFPATLTQNGIVVTAQVNRVNTQLVLDTGAEITLLAAATVKSLLLARSQLTVSQLIGVGGAVSNADVYADLQLGTADFQRRFVVADIYSAHTRTRKSAGSMTRKLSVTWSQ